MNITEQKLKSFEHLPEGWHYGSEGPLLPTVVARGIEWNKFFLENGFTETDAFPISTDQVLVTAYCVDKNKDHHCLSVTSTDEDTDTSFQHELNVDEVACADHVAYDEVKKQLEAIISQIFQRSNNLSKAI